MQLYSIWKGLTGLPLVGDTAGKRAFTFAYARMAPYFGSFHPRMLLVEPNRAEVLVPNRRSNHNHIGTVHAIALCNGLEMAMGALAEATVPAGKRWIPKGMEVAYTAKADTDITCVAATDQIQWDEADGDLAVRVKGVRSDGTVVIEGHILLWVTPRKPR